MLFLNLFPRLRKCARPCGQGEVEFTQPRVDSVAERYSTQLPEKAANLRGVQLPSGEAGEEGQEGPRRQPRDAGSAGPAGPTGNPGKGRLSGKYYTGARPKSGP